MCYGCRSCKLYGSQPATLARSSFRSGIDLPCLADVHHVKHQAETHDMSMRGTFVFDMLI